MKKHIPNLITCLNATSGTVAIYLAFNGYLYWAAWAVVLAMVFDFFDGFAARLLHVKSEMGKELDSLADVISFGVVPAALSYFLIRAVLEESVSVSYATWQEFLLLGVPVIIPAFSAYRLAKFNLDTRQTHSFIGLPTPSNALFWVMLVFTYHFQEDFFLQVWGNPWLLAACVVILSVLLISEVPMFSLKLTSFSWRENALLYCFLGAVIIGFVLWNVKALSYMIPVYILISCYDFRKRLNWIFWGILVVLMIALGPKALFIIPAYLIILIVKFTSGVKE